MYLNRRRFAASVALMGLLSCAAIVVAATHVSFRPVVLKEGRHGRYGWQATVARANGRHGGRRPCVGVSLVDFRAKPSNFVTQRSLKVCSTLAPRQAPNIVSATIGSGGSKVTVTGMAFAPSVKVVQLDLGQKGERELRLKLLNQKQAQIAGVRIISYSAFVVPGSLCLHQFTAYGQSGEEVFKSSPEQCAET